MCRVIPRGLGLVLALSVVVVLAAGGPRARGAAVFPGQSTVDGKTLGQWTTEWWKWAESFGPGPFSDTTGARSNLNQGGPVYYLAGSGGNAGPITRNVTVGSDRKVLLPLINWIVAAGADPGFADTRSEANALATNTINPANLFATIDGVPVPNLASHREESGALFTLNVVPNNDSGFPPGTYTDAYGDGYWLMLEPLSPGQHTLHFGGTSTPYNAGAFTVDQFAIDVTVNLNVVPVPAAAWVGTMGAACAMAWRRRLARRG